MTELQNVKAMNEAIIQPHLVCVKEVKRYILTVAHEQLLSENAAAQAASHL
jgi:hypothetical protein